MSTRPPPPPDVLRDDPGPWSVVSSVFAYSGRPGRRQAPAPMGLMLSPPPEIGLPLAGVDAASAVAGLGPVVVVAAAREPALALAFDDGDEVVRGVSPGVVRAWSVPELRVVEEERPQEDPAAAVADPVHPADLAGGGLSGAVTDPTGAVRAVLTREGRLDVLALLREDASLVRWMRGVRAAAWSSDGTLLALGGTWGVLLARSRESSDG